MLTNHCIGCFHGTSVTNPFCTAHHWRLETLSAGGDLGEVSGDVGPAFELNLTVAWD